MAALMPQGKQQYFTAGGIPLVGGKVYTYAAGTTTPLATYTTSAASTPNANPVILDSRGEASIFFSAANYKIVVKDSLDSTIWTQDNLAGDAAATIVANLAASTGSSLVGHIASGAGAVATTVQAKLRESVSVKDFGAVGDGVTDDTAAIQAAVTHCGLSGSSKRILIPYGAAGIYKITNAIFFNVGGITLEWENNSIVLKKFYNGGMIVVNAAYITLVNPGLDGNGATYTGGGVLYNRSDVYFTFGCRIENPNIRNTKDSGVLFYGPRGAPDIVIDGGSITTWQDPAFAGTSSSGYPSIRIIGAYDGSGGTSPRVFNGITSSSAILLDLTGFNCCKVTNCFTGTILFRGNPDVTGGTPPYVTGQNQILNTYIRDGIVLDGFENTVDSCLSHGNAPLTWTSYGGKPATFSTYGWEIAASSQLCKTGPNNVVTSQIIDNGAQGVAVGLMSSSFENAQTWSIQWLATVNPAIGNGSFYVSYDTVSRHITARFRLTIGSTTTLGTGGWKFTIPRWMSTNVPAIGRFNMYRPGIGTLFGDVALTGTGSIHNVGLFDSAAVQLSGAYAAGFPVGTTIDVQITYLRG